MICSLLEGLIVSQSELLCPAKGWPTRAAEALALTAALVSLVWAVMPTRRSLHRLAGLMAVLAALGFGFAAALPAMQAEAAARIGGTYAVLIDNSESQTRGGEVADRQARSLLAERVGRAIARLPEPQRWSGRVFHVGAAASEVARLDQIAALPDAIAAADPGPPAQATNLAAGLGAALAAIDEGPGSGSIFLMTDGLITDGETEREIARAAALAIPIHVLSRPAERPAAGLLSYDIGPDQALGRPAVLRGTILGGGRLAWDVNGENPGEQTVEAPPASRGPQGLRVEISFARRGIGYVTLGFHPDTGAVLRQERVFTLVRGPAHLLVYGPARWIEGASRADYAITRADASDPVKPASYDAVIVDGLAPGAFPVGFPDGLLAAAAAGTGILIVNGPQRGSIEDRQLIADWEATALGPVLPVHSDPQKFIADPPRRDVLIILDLSGSMDGPRAAAAKPLAKAILRALRPVDSLTILPFASNPGAPFNRASVTEAAKRDAEAFIDRLTVGGGTNAKAAMRQAGALRGNNCQFFIIGDGDQGYSAVESSPLCFTTLIGVEGTSFPDAVKRDQYKRLPLGWRGGELKLEAFEPEQRDAFWREGPFVPIAVEAADASLAPPLAVAGIALTYARPWPATRIHLIPPDGRPDPVFAVRRDPDRPLIVAGVFSGAVPDAWARTPKGKEASDALLRKLISWDDPQRFDIDLRQAGAELAVRITAQGDEPAPNRLSASILLASGTTVPLALTPDGPLGVFAGTVRPSLGAAPQQATLVIEPDGKDPQAIPLTLPPLEQSNSRGSGTPELLTAGLNGALLAQMREATGGLDLRYDVPSVAAQAQRPPPLAIWPAVVGLSAVLFAASLFLGGARR